MVIGSDIAYPEVCAALMPAEAQLGRKVSPTIYSREDFNKKLNEKNSFLTHIMAQPKILLIGSGIKQDSNAVVLSTEIVYKY